MADRRAESGNVLFLILVAVILFAALSYAVTRSTQTNGNQVDEGTTISAAQIAQYPSGTRTAILRMIIAGIPAESLKFNPPEDFGALADTDECVFHPAGGGAVYQMADHGVMASDLSGKWHFNAEFEIEHIGLQVPSDAQGNDIVAFLPGIREGVCARLNREAGIQGAIPNLTADLSAQYTEDMDDQYAMPSGEASLGLSAGNGSGGLSGQPFGCFRNNGGEYVYYHVLVER